MRNGTLIAALVAVGTIFWSPSTDAASKDRSRFSDEPAPLQTESFPERPKPLLEWGDKFLGNGNIQDGFTLPTGAVWHPSLWVYGNYRSAVQSFDNGTTRVTEWANDLNLFGNLQLAATERVLIGIAPFRNKNGQFTGYNFEPSHRGVEDFTENSLQPRTLFFEGELGELFPTWDQADKRSLDYGISVGRQPLSLQDGILVNDDSLDMVSVTRNALLPSFGSHMRISGLFAWNEIERGNNVEDSSAYMFGVDGFADLPKTTIEADLLYVSSGNQGDGFFAGLGAIQRIGKVSTTFRINQSIATESASVGIQSGTMLFAEASIEPAYTHNVLYLNGYWGIDDFTSAIRGPVAGGPLGRTGLMFAAVGLGRYGSPLSNVGQRSVGGAMGYQMFFGDLRRRQLVFELGGLTHTDSRNASASAFGTRYQHALGQRTVMIVDAFGAMQENAREAIGARLEFLVKF
ncbi:MAG: hypothetical protein ACPGVU_18245 [Limisphaerales bacterium]